MMNHADFTAKKDPDSRVAAQPAAGPRELFAAGPSASQRKARFTTIDLDREDLARRSNYIKKSRMSMANAIKSKRTLAHVVGQRAANGIELDIPHLVPMLVLERELKARAPFELDEPGLVACVNHGLDLALHDSVLVWGPTAVAGTMQAVVLAIGLYFRTGLVRRRVGRGSSSQPMLRDALCHLDEHGDVERSRTGSLNY